MRDFIKNKKTKNFRIKGVQIFVKDPPAREVDLKLATSSALRRVPEHLLTNLETIYFGKFEYLDKLDLQAMYMNSSIFISNEIEDEEEIIDDLVHEVAHSIEEVHKEEIYFDGLLEKEFLQKRKSLWFSMKERGLSVELSDFLETEYNESFDLFLYKKIGYPVLSMYTKNLFYSPYATTSLREYFANGFEAFFMKEDLSRLKNLSPVLYEKLLTLVALEPDIKNQSTDNFY